MKFAVATKHLHLVVSYRDPDDEDEIEAVTGEGGSFEVAPTTGTPTGDDIDEMHFGFARA